ncbi:nucleotide pyrophosphohydrolase [Halalkalibacillus sediminis]|uniref:Nucleotide pyrophosphohydrolase n=1 Tax=Halalkalibacillus sediminis TaxID=2018042 RepID=A0A2I0QX00_9BACI|nr:nucleotide pyrophosphohydrolase [Halalkalibacillus sediminis]PKR78835.1 nucleotide pyrophosphohydrolase [Halalkalibacillus sediminis]
MEAENHTIVQAQERVDRFISQFEEGYFSPTTMILRLAEELGELSREVNHLYGEKPKKKTEKEKRIEDELGDLFFVLITFANSLDIDLNEAFEISMSKIETRDQNRWTLKEEENE